MKRKLLVAILVMVLGVGASVAIYAAVGGFSNEPVAIESCCVEDAVIVPLNDDHMNGGPGWCSRTGSCCGGVWSPSCANMGAFGRCVC